MPRGKVGAVSAEWPPALPERLDRTRSEGRTGEESRIERESSAKNVAPRSWLGYAVRAGMAKTVILVRMSTLTAESHDRHFGVNRRAAALLIAEFARRKHKAGGVWGRVINISGDAA